jgi:hypothetical protein
MLYRASQGIYGWKPAAWDMHVDAGECSSMNNLPKTAPEFTSRDGNKAGKRLAVASRPWFARESWRHG